MEKQIQAESCILTISGSANGNEAIRMRIFTTTLTAYGV
jgi:hypothetical protein